MLSNLPEAAPTAGVGFKPWPAGPTARASCPTVALTLHLMGISAGAETETEEETETWERQRWRPRQGRRWRQRRDRDTGGDGDRGGDRQRRRQTETQEETEEERDGGGDGDRGETETGQTQGWTQRHSSDRTEVESMQLTHRTCEHSGARLCHKGPFRKNCKEPELGPASTMLHPEPTSWASDSPGSCLTASELRGERTGGGAAARS